MSGMMDTRIMDDEEEEDEEEEGDDFRERVAWQSKYDAKACFGCGSAFNPLTNRHHHCRACGRVVCGNCSNHKDKVKGYSKRQRTCDECHEALETQFTVKKLVSLLCPCVKLLKREIKKARTAQLLYDGAIFVRKKKGLGKMVTGFLSGGKEKKAKQQKVSATDGDADADASEKSRKVKVKLRSDGLVLAITPVGGFLEDTEEVYLHDVRNIEPKGSRGITILGANETVLFQGDMTDKSLRDDWVKALSAAALEAKAKPPPAKNASNSVASRVKFGAMRAKKEIELQSKKRDAEKRKESYLKGSGGLKYTALAMAEREKQLSTNTGNGDLV